MLRALSWILALLAVAIGHYTHTPYGMRIRGFEIFLIVLFGLTAIAATRKPAIAAVAALGLVLGLTREIQFERARQRVESSPIGQRARLGRHLVVGYRSASEAEKWLEEGKIGGIFVGAKNARDRSLEELSVELASLRRHGARWIAADQEGGAVSRLSPPLAALPPLSTVAGDLAGVEAYGESHGRDLEALGVDLNFAPVLDLATGLPPALLDLHTRIEERALGADPQQVGDAAIVYAGALERHGVMATFKHFPGLGRVSADTHNFEARVHAPIADLEATDWAPFRAVIAERSGAIMVGHVIVESVDRDRIATRSRAVISGILRESMGHQGLIVTDDLCMAPAFHGPGGVGQAAVDALRAGVDLLLVSYDPDQWFVVMAALLDADDAGLLAAPIADSMLRLESGLSRNHRDHVESAHDRIFSDPRASGAPARGAGVRDASDGARLAGM